MRKLIFGSLLMVAGVFISMTGIGVLIGLPMAIFGFMTALAGMAQLGWWAVKGGIAAGKAVNRNRTRSDADA